MQAQIITLVITMIDRELMLDNNKNEKFLTALKTAKDALIALRAFF